MLSRVLLIGNIVHNSYYVFYLKWCEFTLEVQKRITKHEKQ
jgi:hypothetical protein